MTNANTAVVAPANSVQEEGGAVKTEASSPPSSPTQHGGSKVYKSGPLFLSSKGIGWTSWKKRWFILTQTSLVFYRSDPNVAPQKGAEVNLTLGGIDLNSSGSVVVKEDKKLITVSFADGRDGRSFTLKAETLEDLHEWKAALEEALTNAPSATAVSGQNDAVKSDQANGADSISEQSNDKQPVKSLVIGRPILLALEDIDGTPSFLEKALRFIEDHGVKTEGILRQAADVEHVERRIQEFEKGKTDFSPDEDAHVIGDCIKYVLRELPSSPVPASCCKALLEAYRTDRSTRVSAMHSAICETFPEPNRRLLQRILNMMQVVASNKTVNRMSVSAVAACMAPLLLRPLLAGDCEIEHDVNVGVDSSAQLLQAAAAANHAQAIVITLLEEYDNIFGDGAQTHEPYTDSEESGSESEEITDDESYEEEEEEEDEEEEEEDEEGESDYVEEDGHESSSTSSEIGEKRSQKKDSASSHSSGTASPRVDEGHESSKMLSSQPQASLPQHAGVEKNDNVLSSETEKMQSNISSKSLGDDDDTSLAQACSESSQGSGRTTRRPTMWGRAPGRKNLSMETIEVSFGEENGTQKVEHNRTDPQASEAAVRSLIQDCLEKRKHDLHEQNAHLEEDVVRLQEQLQREMDLATTLVAELKNWQPLSVSSLTDDKIKAELVEIVQLEENNISLKKKASDLELQLGQQRNQISTFVLELGGELQLNPVDRKKLKAKQSDGRASSFSSRKFSRSKRESSLDKSEADNHKRHDSASSLHTPQNQNQQSDSSQNMKGIASFARAFTGEIGMGKPPGSVSRKASTKGEGTTSALSKLTNRLNFLKERRTQIANELQNMDKGRNTSHSSENQDQAGGSEASSQSAENPDKHQESKGQSSSSEKGQEPESHDSRPNPNSQNPQNAEKGRKSGGPQGLERGRSESNSMMEKGLALFNPRSFARS
ncbi:rho GTPase-activating protein REN1 [Andrographis paniculata]|uniref:rho GTPase-activating protein REN1 n=1 Tax=Andrographis paniculata TaxID=175694 RepID=UPI0021E8524F|nr:rho GTPase-activating protein REN1 [Andrographis paniculata]